MQVKEGFLGVDVGSISTKAAVIDKDENILAKKYIWTEGDPITAVRRLLMDIEKQIKNKNIKIVGTGTTGSARELIGCILNATIVKNEITANAIGTLTLHPDVRTIFEIGGQDSKIIVLNNGVVVDYAMNTLCAAGTGSFLSSQARRLDIPIEDFGRYSLKAKSATKIAGRCLTENNFLLTTEGTKSIKDIKEGDFVLSKGRFKKVTKKYERDYTGELYKITRRYSKDAPLILTSEHPILAIKSKLCPYVKFKYICREDCNRKSIRPRCKLNFFQNYSPQWIEVDSLKPYDLIVTPKHNTKKIFKENISKDLMRVVGYYLAEGCIYSGKGERGDSIEFAFNQKEKAYIKDTRYLMSSIFRTKPGTIDQNFYTGKGVRLRFSSKKAYNFFKQFGRKAYNKKILEWIFDLPKEHLLELIKGFWRGDGSFSKNNLTIYTCSSNLFEGLCAILEKCGYIPSRKKYFSQDIGKITSRLKKRNHNIIRRHPLYKIELGGTQTKQLFKDLEIKPSKKIQDFFKNRKRTYQIAYNKRDHILYPIRKIEKDFVKNVKVYNLEVEDTHSYLVNGFLCHNCTVFSESDMVHKAQIGHSKEDIIAGLCRAIVNNYLNNVGKGKDIQPPIVFQGGVSKNIGVIKAFEEITGHKIIVDEDGHLMGAYGAAILALKNPTRREFNFDIKDIKFETRGIDCGGCANNCEIVCVLKNGVFLDGWGNRCAAGIERAKKVLSGNV